MTAMKQPQVEVLDLSRLEALSLQADLEREHQTDVELVEQPLPSGKYGEVATIVVSLIATQVALNLLATWIAKNRSRRRVRVRYVTQHPDGSTASAAYDIELDESTTSADVLKQLGNLPLVPPPLDK